jgi:la-related protein 1
MQPKMEQDVSNLKSMPKGLSASLPDLDSESWIEVKKRPKPSPARTKVSGVGSSHSMSS